MDGTRSPSLDVGDHRAKYRTGGVPESEPSLWLTLCGEVLLLVVSQLTTVVTVSLGCVGSGLLTRSPQTVGF